MLRALFLVFSSLVVGSTGFIIKKDLFKSDYRHYATKDSIPLKESDVAHWTYLSSLLMFSEENEENDGASSFFGIQKVVRDEEETSKIKLEDADRVIDNAHRLRIKCYEHLNRIKKTPAQKDPSPKTIELIKDWCFATSRKFSPSFEQFRGFFNWEYTNNKRIFITTNKATHSKNSQNVELPGFFLVNLIPHMDTLSSIKGDTQLDKVLRNFHEIKTTDFYSCLYDPISLFKKNKYNGRYWIGYSEDELNKNDLGDNDGLSNKKSSPEICSSKTSSEPPNKKIGWMTYFYNIANPTAQITHYQIAKTSQEIKNLPRTSQTP